MRGFFISEGAAMAKHQIKHRWNNSVLFECDVPDDMESGLHARYALEKAVESGAYLSGAYLSGANLSDANLTGAKWRNWIVINKPPIQLFGLRWRVTILDEHMQIGCELHKLSDWADYDDKRICEMDGRDALRFWRAHKDALLGLAKGAGRMEVTDE
jgi:hypothetical protein